MTRGVAFEALLRSSVSDCLILVVHGLVSSPIPFIHSHALLPLYPLVKDHGPHDHRKKNSGFFGNFCDF